MLSDGTAGLSAIKTGGGVAVVPDLKEALSAEMPQHALEPLEADFPVKAAEAAPPMQRLTTEPASPHGVVEVPEQIKMEVRMVASHEDPIAALPPARTGVKSGLPAA